MAKTLMDTPEEISRWFSTLPLQKINTLYLWGVGSGTWLIPLKSWFEENPLRKVVVVEENPDVLKTFLKSSLSKTILNHSQIVILPLENWMSAIEEYLLHPNSQKFYITALPSLLNEKNFRVFQNTLSCRIENFALTRDEVLNFGGSVLNNFYHNIIKLPKASFGATLFGKFSNIPAIVVGAGPSLKHNLSVLEKNKNKAIIFSGGTAMNALSGSQVIPHFGIAVDPNPFQMSRLMMNQTFETPTFYENRLLSDALELIQGSKIYLSSFIPGTIDYWFEDKLGLKPFGMDAGMSVTTLNLVQAVLLGCNPIILVGVDLAYSEGDSYAPGVVSHAFHTMREDFITKQAKDDLLEATDINGEKIYTLWKWLEESLWISNFAKTHSEHWFINATEGGLGFEGVDNIPIGKLFEKIPDSPVDLEKKVFEEIFSAKMPEGVTRKRICDLLSDLLDSFKDVEKKINQLNFEKEGVEPIEKALCYEAFLKRFISDYSRIFALDLKKDKEAYYKNFCAYLKAGCQINIKLIERTLNDSKLLDEFNSEPVVAVEKTISFSKIIRDSEGRIRIGLNEKEGLRDGLCYFYDEAGHLRSLLSYKEGRLDGEVSLFNKGVLVRRLHFKEGQWEGKEEWFLDNGTVWLEAEYHESKPVNEAKMWYDNGQLKELRVFREGKLADNHLYLIDGQELSLNPTKDFFEHLVESTAKLQSALEGLFSKVQGYTGEELQANLDQLKALQQSMENQLREVEAKEAIWKTDSTKDVINVIIDKKSLPMIDNIEKALKELEKNDTL